MMSKNAQAALLAALCTLTAVSLAGAHIDVVGLDVTTLAVKHLP